MGNCNGNCGSCGGCARELTLTAPELELLRELGQIPFLPVGRRVSSLTPIDPESPTEERSLVLEVLEKKGLISLDYDKPISGLTEKDYGDLPLRGSMALTQRGQTVLELVEYQGIEGEA